MLGLLFPKSRKAETNEKARGDFGDYWTEISGEEGTKRFRHRNPFCASSRVHRRRVGGRTKYIGSWS